MKTAQATQTKLNDVLMPAGEKAQADIAMVSDDAWRRRQPDG